MRTILKSVIIYGLCITPTFAITLEDGWDTLQQKSHSLAIKKLEKSALQDSASAKSFLYMPKISVKGMAIKTDAPNFENSKNLTLFLHPQLPVILGEKEKSDNTYTKTNITAVWNLYAGGQMSAVNAIYDSKVLAAESTLQKEKITVFNAYVKAYYGVLTAQSIYETYEKSQSVLKTHLENAQKLKKQGQISKMTLLQAQVTFEDSVVKTHKAKNNYILARKQLAILLKTPVNEPIDTHFVLPKKLPSLSDTQQKVLTHNPSFDILKHNMNQADNAVAAQTGKHYPSVNILGQYAMQETKLSIGDTLPRWAVGVVLEIPLVNPKNSYSEIASLRKKQVMLERSQIQAQENIKLYVEKLHMDLQQNIETFSMLENSKKASEENVKLQRSAFRQGLISVVKVMEAESLCNKIKTQQIAENYAYIQNLSQLLSASQSYQEFFDMVQMQKPSPPIPIDEKQIIAPIPPKE